MRSLYFSFRRPCTVALFGVLAIVLVACGDTPTEPEQDPDPDSEVSVESSFTIDPEEPAIGDEVTLDGTDSSIEGADELSFMWTLDQPDESQAAVAETNAETTSFEVDVEGTYEITLEVSAEDAADSATESFTVEEDEGGSGDMDRAVWTYETDAYLTTAPALGPDGAVYIGDALGSGGLFAFTENGDEKWSRSMEVGTPTVSEDGNTLYVGSSGEDKLYALDAETGEEEWSFDAEGELSDVYHTALDSDGMLYLAVELTTIESVERSLYAIDSEADNEADRVEWSADINGSSESHPAVDESGSVVYVGSEDGRLHAVSTVDGEPLWDVQINSDEDRALLSSPAIGEQGTVYVGSTDGALYAVTPEGEVDWTFDEIDVPVDGDPVIGPNGDHIYVVGNSDEPGENDRLFAVDTNGDEVWTTVGTPPAPPAGSPVVGDDGTIYYNADDGLVAINPDDGSREWAFSSDGFVRAGPVVSSDGTLYFGSEGQTLYALDSDSQGLSESSPWPLVGQSASRSGTASE